MIHVRHRMIACLTIAIIRNANRVKVKVALFVSTTINAKIIYVRTVSAMHTSWYLVWNANLRHSVNQTVVKMKNVFKEKRRFMRLVFIIKSVNQSSAKIKYADKVYNWMIFAYIARTSALENISAFIQVPRWNA